LRGNWQITLRRILSSKSFYAYVRSKAKAKINVGPLVNKDGAVISLSEETSEEFNKFFISVFTNEGNESIPEAEWMNNIYKYNIYIYIYKYI